MLFRLILSVLIINSLVFAEVCEGFGPQTPRDIAQTSGSNKVNFSIAPAYNKMNLCNIHTHTHAEHKAPGYSIPATDKHGGYKCNETSELTSDELKPVSNPTFKAVKPGDTIEVHWVHSSCDVKPGQGLGSCLSDACANPNLRVEAQSFLLVNDSDAADFSDFAYEGNTANGYHQAKMIPSSSGDPVVFTGSTTGPSFTEQTCSPLLVTWSVRPQCIKLDINSLHKWGKDNVFNESKSHGVRKLVTSPELLSEIN